MLLIPFANTLILKRQTLLFMMTNYQTLTTAKALGMRTILVNRADVEQHDACYKTEDLPSFMASLVK